MKMADWGDLSGLATGIGSLPYQSAAPALELIFKYLPEIPFWPQLPKRDIREGMVAQFSENLPCLELGKEGLVFTPRDKEKQLEEFYSRVIDNDLDYFKITPQYAQGLYAFYQRLESSGAKRIRAIKLHVTGPFTFAAGLKDEKGVALLHDPVLMQAIVQGLAMKALWQIKLFEKFGKIIVFIDEPYLGCFGSAYTPINRDNAVKTLAEFSERIIAGGNVLAGLHCCGNTDWSILTDVASIGIINFDAFGFLDRLLIYSGELRKFFEQGRKLCWGIVPTNEFNPDLTPEELSAKIDYGIDCLVKKGLDREKIRANLLLSPGCGLGTLDAEKSEAIIKMLSEVSRLMRKI